MAITERRKKVSLAISLLGFIVALSMIVASAVFAQTYDFDQGIEVLSEGLISKKEEALKNKKIAVFGIIDSKSKERFEISPHIEDGIIDLLVNKGYMVIERRRIEDVIKKEIKKGTDWWFDEAQAAQFGRLVGADIIITGRYVRWGRSMLKVSIRAISVGDGKIIAANSVKVLTDRIADLLKPEKKRQQVDAVAPEKTLSIVQDTIENKAHKLAVDVISDQKNLRIYIKPIVEGNDRYVSDFSNSFTSRVKSEIIRLHKDVEVIDEKPIYKRLSNTRGIKKKAKTVKNLKTSDAFFVDANAVLEGNCFDRGESVTVDLYLKDLAGKVLNSSTVDIDKSLIKASLENKQAKMLADLADVLSEEGASKVKISTTKGGDYPVYYRGEKIKFHIQVAGPLYVYMYDINSRGEVTLLYPYEKNSIQQKLMPGRLYTIPSETDNFELEVEPPFGMDAVKIFASTAELPIPELTPSVGTRSYTGNTRAIVKKRKEIQEGLSRMKSINPRDLVDYYRGVVGRFGAKLYEDSLMLETRAE